MTEAEVREMMRQAGLEGGFGWVCAYLATVATARMNSVIPGGIEAAKRFVQLVIDGLKDEVERNENPGKKYIQEKILSSLFRIGDGETSSIKKLDKIIAFPDVPILTEDTQASLRLESLQTQNADALSRLSHLRNPTKAIRGEALAKQAERMSGYFEWVDSKYDGNAGMPADQLSDKNGVITYQNDFVKWVKTSQTTSPLTKKSKMNCWEAVFVVACYAALIGYDQLRRIYGFGTGAQAPISNAQHLLLVRNALGRPQAFKTIREISLVPSRGDVVFAADDMHVMICLGTDLVRGELEINVMSLWTTPEKRFCKTTTNYWQVYKDLVMFVPCPF